MARQEVLLHLFMLLNRKIQPYIQSKLIPRREMATYRATFTNNLFILNDLASICIVVLHPRGHPSIAYCDPYFRLLEATLRDSDPWLAANSS